MEIQQLKGFLAVAKHKNFTLAAKKTLRTQPTISLQVKSLEEEFGVKLFERLGPKNVRLTDEGKLLQKLCSPLLQEFLDLPSRFNEARGMFSKSEVRVVTHSSVMIYLFPEVIKAFKKKFPDCHLCILNRNQSEIVAMIDSGEADFGITSLQTTPPASVDYRVLANYSRILITTKNHPLSEKSNITLADIAKYPLILPTQDSNTRKIIDKVFADRGLNYELTMEVVGRTAIKTYVGMNLGTSILNEYYVTKEDKNRLFVKNMSRLFGKAETGVITRKGKRQSLPVQTFIDLVSARCRA